MSFKLTRGAGELELELSYLPMNAIVSVHGLEGQSLMYGWLYSCVTPGSSQRRRGDSGRYTAVKRVSVIYR